MGNEQRKIGDKVIQKTRIIGTNIIVYTAWEPSAMMGNHATITTIDGAWYGRIGTKRIPKGIDILPVGTERTRAVNKWHFDQYTVAYNLITKAFPETHAGRFSMGEITMEGSEPPRVIKSKSGEKGVGESIKSCIRNNVLIERPAPGEPSGDWKEAFMKAVKECTGPSVTMTEEDLEQSVYDGVWYPVCPHCGERTPAEPDAESIRCTACDKGFRIVNPYI